ncbi:MAG: NUDIX hydrolase [Cyclobacteriaceae bacterium]|nr:NUDIX hydrolase [Cyclobacteriaceae bacterium]MCK5208502.1 NUDIX hydrolase [Cyclobacteriaceae bacterium]MCK5367758.1 NUDIX hydrolase [Cyclobacteriaceae bacterium]
MDRALLIQALNNYQTSSDEEKATIPRFKSLLTNFSNCYKRSLLTGHMTASAWIMDEFGTSVLLVHHKKLNRWLQPGGHADGDENIIAVATREAREETGLKSLRLIEEDIFDIDIHLIPKHKNVNSHYHHDIRFLFVAERTENYVISDESNELAWIPMDKIYNFTGNNISIHRMVLKTKLIFK